MNITAAILTIKEEFKSEELSEVLKHEREVIEQWKQAGYIHDMYLRQTKNGAVILFKELDENKVYELIGTLPLFPYLKPVEYLGLLK
ncbi:MAG: muconolactone Delta-isomerase family protein [Ferruginibacter sp.]